MKKTSKKKTTKVSAGGRYFFAGPPAVKKPPRQPKPLTQGYGLVVKTPAGFRLGYAPPRPVVGAYRERRCRGCGCTEADCRHCIARTGGPCRWVAADLCSACLPPREGGAA